MAVSKLKTAIDSLYVGVIFFHKSMRQKMSLFVRQTTLVNLNNFPETESHIWASWNSEARST